MRAFVFIRQVSTFFLLSSLSHCTPEEIGEDTTAAAGKRAAQDGATCRNRGLLELRGESLRQPSGDEDKRRKERE